MTHPAAGQHSLLLLLSSSSQRMATNWTLLTWLRLNYYSGPLSHQSWRKGELHGSWCYVPSCWGRWRAKDCIRRYSSSTGSHKEATLHWQASSSSGKRSPDWCSFWIPLALPATGEWCDKSPHQGGKKTIEKDTSTVRQQAMMGMEAGGL